jgi:hypothetical protein
MGYTVSPIGISLDVVQEPFHGNEIFKKFKHSSFELFSAYRAKREFGKKFQ